MWDKEPVKTGGGMCIERLRVWMIGSKVHIVLELIEGSGGYIVDSAPAFWEMSGSTNTYMRVVGCGEGELK